MKNNSVKTVVAVGIGAALFFVLGKLSIPSGIPNTNISLQYAVLGLFSVLYGPVAGLLIGFVGHALIDATAGWGVWWSWVIASAFAGCLMGLLGGKIGLAKGQFGKKEIVTFVLISAVTHVVTWGVVAPVLDIVIYAEPANLVFVQGLVAGIANAVTTAVVGGLLALAYSKTIAKQGSLDKE